MSALERIFDLLAQASRDGHLPPTILYNEGWMLRLVLDWCASHPAFVEPFIFLDGSSWCSEALLPSRFLGRGSRREGFTHADGVIGHFRFKPGGRGDIELLPDGRQLSVFEAKMASLLSSGTAHAKGYNQAARNVACMAHVAVDQPSALNSLERISFTVLAPRQRIQEGAFAEHLDAASVSRVVAARASAFDSESANWYSSAFRAFLPRCVISAVAWEDAVAAITTCDAAFGAELAEFYALCLRYNPIAPARSSRRHATVTGPAV
jgi:hypothetical protein